MPPTRVNTAVVSYQESACTAVYLNVLHIFFVGVALHAFLPVLHALPLLRLPFPHRLLNFPLFHDSLLCYQDAVLLIPADIRPATDRHGGDA